MQGICVRGLAPAVVAATSAPACCRRPLASASAPATAVATSALAALAWLVQNVVWKDIQSNEHIMLLLL